MATNLGRPQILLELDEQIDYAEWYDAAGMTDGDSILKSGIWYYKLTRYDENKPFDFWSSNDTYNVIRKYVGSVRVGTDLFTRVTSYQFLMESRNTFYFDARENMVLIHFDWENMPYFEQTIKLGLVIGFSKTLSNSAYVSEEGVVYDPRIKKAGVIKNNRDKLYFGVIQNDSLSLTLTNDDRKPLDSLLQRYLFGNSGRVKLGFEGEAYEDFRTVFSGKISNIPILSLEDVVIQLKSNRAFYSKKIPDTTFSLSDYPDISDDTEGQYIPLIWGTVRQAKGYNLQETLIGNSTFTYKFCTTELDLEHYDILAVDKVYANDIEITPTAIDLVNGTVTCASADVKDGSSFLKISADIRGYEEDGSLIENSLEILRKILFLFLNVGFNDSAYYMNEWSDAEVVAKNIGLYIDKPKSIENIIKDISTTEFGDFILRGDGKITFLREDRNTIPTYYVKKSNELSGESANYDSDQYLSKSVVAFNYNNSTKNWRYYTDTSHEDAVIEEYGIENSKTFETLLTNKADATELAERLMNNNDTVVPVFPLTLPLDYYNIEIFDKILVEIQRTDAAFYGDIEGILESVSLDLDRFIVKADVRYENDVDIVDGVLQDESYIIDGGGAEDNYGVILTGGTSTDILINNGQGA